MNRKQILRLVLGLTLAAVVCIGVFVASVLYMNTSAEMRARVYCNSIPIDSDISIATARAEAGKLLWGAEDGYTFYFPGFIFEKAVCQVTVSKEGRVLAKKTEMDYA